MNPVQLLNTDEWGFRQLTGIHPSEIEQREDKYRVGEKHEFLLKSDGTLTKNADRMIGVREYIDNLPETARAFSQTEVEGIKRGALTTTHMDFCGTWKLHDIYGPKRKPIYANPNYKHNHKFTSMVVKCECGANVDSMGDRGRDRIKNAHEHTDDCKSVYRVEAKAELCRKRYEEMKRLSRLGWHVHRLGPRLGFCSKTACKFAERNGLDPRELRRNYLRIAGNTYKHLVHNVGEDPQYVADVYGSSPRTMRERAQKFGDETKLAFP